MSVLNRAGVPYAYEIIDNKAVAAAVETRSYNLPVVDVDGRIFVRPAPIEIVNIYQEYR